MVYLREHAEGGAQVAKEEFGVVQGQGCPIVVNGKRAGRDQCFTKKQ